MNLPDVTALVHPDSDSAFVNGGAVYADIEAVTHRPWQEAADDASDVEATHRIGDSAPSPTADNPRPRRAGPMRRRADPMRRRADRTTRLDPGTTGPIETQLPADDDGGPPTAVGLAPPGAEAWHRDRTSRHGARDRSFDTTSRRGARDNGFDTTSLRGTPDTTSHRGTGDSGPNTAVSAPFDLAGDDGVRDNPDPPIDAEPDEPPAGLSAAPRRRARAATPSAGQAWAVVVAQWIAGAIGGAALWVGFRFLWRDLPVVALAAAVLVTVGLVLGVRALMHNGDRRTTIFAVLVGLLLTVSPAILVLLGR
jgi:hypothetical protein